MNEAELINIYPIKETSIEIKKLNVWFNETHILCDIDTNFIKNEINCIIGPSGSGKSTLIRSIDRINDETPGFNFEGKIAFDKNDIHNKSIDVVGLRKNIGMVFQKPCVFPKSISENLLFGIRHSKKLSKPEKQRIVEDNLKSVSLWKETAHRLNESAASLSIGQQQRLCIARTLAVGPKVILLDEPTSSLDPISTKAIEQLMLNLKKKYTIIFVTHDIQQAKRIADNIIFMCDGKIIEQGAKEKLFYSPENEQTKAYLKSEVCDCS